MKATLRYFFLLAVFLVIFSLVEIKEKFPIMIGIVLGVTIAYWVSYAIIEKKRKKQN